MVSVYMHVFVECGHSKLYWSIIDVRVTDTDHGAPSYVGCSVAAVLATAEEEKKVKYLSWVEAHHVRGWGNEA